MLTKEECVQTLNDLYEFSTNAKMYYASRDYHFYILKQLINEHFELKEKFKTLAIQRDSLLEEYGKLRWNPPLRFEDLEEGMWVWDNKFECYEKIHGIDKYLGIMFENGFYGEWFEENRFYRYEVKENG